MSTFISPTWEGRVLSLACTNPTIIVSLHPLGLFGLHALWCERAKLSHKERMCLDFPLTSNEASVDSKLYSVLQRNFLLKPFSKTQWAPESTHCESATTSERKRFILEAYPRFLRSRSHLPHQRIDAGRCSPE
jgi:hypothetical protein